MNVIQLSQKRAQKLPLYNVMVVGLYQQEYFAFSECYQKTNFEFICNRLNQAKGNANEIFDILCSLIEQQLIPIIYPIGEATECLCNESEVEDKAYNTILVLEDSPFTDAQMENYKKEYIEKSILHVKITKEDLFAFQNAFVNHIPSVFKKDLQNARTLPQIVDVLSDLLTYEIFPIFWPLRSKYDVTDDELFYFDFNVLQPD